MKKILRGGTVVTGSDSLRADVLIDGEKVAAVGSTEEIARLAEQDKMCIRDRLQPWAWRW